MLDGIDRLRNWARALRKELHAIYLAARNPKTPWYAKLLAVAVVGYALSPIDLIPDFIPVLGLLDDLIVVPLGIRLVLSLIPQTVMAECRTLASEAEERPRGKAAATIIVAIWAAGAVWLAWVGVTHWH